MTIKIKPTATTAIIEHNDSAILTVDSSGNLTVANDLSVTGTSPSVDSLSTASGSAPSYSARAWVKFKGTGTVSIYASGNVSSVTDNGAGDYTVNFTTALEDANYSATVSLGGGSSNFPSNSHIHSSSYNSRSAPTTTTLRFSTFVWNSGTTGLDMPDFAVNIFR